LFSAHNSCQEIFPKPGVISLSGGLKVNSITSDIYISVFGQFVNQDFQKDFSPLLIIGVCDIIRIKNPGAGKRHKDRRRQGVKLGLCFILLRIAHLRLTLIAWGEL
jgi:hypothetical protein